MCGKGRRAYRRQSCRCLWVLGFVLCAGTVFAAEPPPVLHAGEDVTLKDVAGTETLVTVIMKDTGAADSNLRVVDVQDNHFSIVTKDNVRYAYPFAYVKEIHVQGGEIDPKRLGGSSTQGGLSGPEKKIVERAYDRAREVFTVSDKEQDRKMRAATLLALNHDREASDYLTELAESGDLATQIEAALCLWLVSAQSPDRDILIRGFESGNRKIKARTALLSGLSGERADVGYMLMMIQDRLADIAAPAAKALARLGNRDCIPTLISMIGELNEEKGQAAVFALSRLGGIDVIEQMKRKYASASGEMKFRIAIVLFNLGDPLGRELMKTEFLDIPTLAPRAARLLARQGEWEAMEYLRQRLNRRFDETEITLMDRAESAAALIAGNDMSFLHVLQDLLRAEQVSVRLRVCELVAELGRNELLSLTQPPIENPKLEIAIEACMAAIAVANPNEFRERLTEMRK